MKKHTMATTALWSRDRRLILQYFADIGNRTLQAKHDKKFTCKYMLDGPSKFEIYNIKSLILIQVEDGITKLLHRTGTIILPQQPTQVSYDENKTRAVVNNEVYEVFRAADSRLYWGNDK
ncbi:hypothetical protein D3C78_19310 [compost metagenome]